MPMRYADIPALHHRAQLTGRPALGAWYRLLGWLALAGVALLDHSCPGCLWALFAAAFGMWLAAWWQQVGALHRLPLQAAALVAMVGLARLRWLDCCSGSCP